MTDVGAKNPSYHPNNSMEDWQAVIHEWARGKGWWEGFVAQNVSGHRFGASAPPEVQRAANNYVAAKLCLVHSELSEALEALRDGDLKMRAGEDGKPEGVESELADTIIRILDLSEALGLDMGKAIADKMAYNEQRAFQHGGRKL